MSQRLHKNKHKTDLHTQQIVGYTNFHSPQEKKVQLT